MRRYIVIAILGLALLAGGIWHGVVRAQTRTDRHALNVQVLGTNLEVSNATNPYLQAVDTTNTMQVRLAALDTSAEVGTESNHDFHFITNSAQEMTILASGDIGIGTVAPGAGLHGVVANGIILWADAEGDDANKAARWGIEHYDVDEEPFFAIFPYNTTSTNILGIGGGTAQGNAATQISFFTAANNTTTTGTEVAKIDSSGYFYFTDRLVDLGDTDTYISSTGSDIIGMTLGGTQKYQYDGSVLTLAAFDNGSGQQSRRIFMGRNTNGANACAAEWIMEQTDGIDSYIWVDDTGDLRITFNAGGGCTNGDTDGVVVGDQESSLATKNITGRFQNYAAALQLIVDTPLFNFTYKSGSYGGQEFTGIVTDFSPTFGKDNGKSLNEVTVTGYLIAAIKELNARVNKLEEG